MACLHRVAMGTLSRRSWSVHLVRGRPGGRFHKGSGCRPTNSSGSGVLVNFHIRARWWRTRQRESNAGIWGGSPRGSRSKLSPWSADQGRSPPEAESFLAFVCQMEQRNWLVFTSGTNLQRESAQSSKRSRERYSLIPVFPLVYDTCLSLRRYH